LSPFPHLESSSYKEADVRIFSFLTSEIDVSERSISTLDSKVSQNTINLLYNYKYDDMFRLTESSSGQSLNHISLGTLSNSAQFWDLKNLYRNKRMWIQMW